MVRTTVPWYERYRLFYWLERNGIDSLVPFCSAVCERCPSFVDRLQEEGGVKKGMARTRFVYMSLPGKLGFCENDAPTVYVAVCRCVLRSQLMPRRRGDQLTYVGRSQVTTPKPPQQPCWVRSMEIGRNRRCTRKLCLLRLLLPPRDSCCLQQ